MILWFLQIFSRMIALFMIVLLFPLWILGALLSLTQKKSPIVWVKIWGRQAHPIQLLNLNTGFKVFDQSGGLFNILKGEMSWVGISIRHYTLEERVLGDEYLFNTSPGLFSLWFIRSSAAIAHEGRVLTETEYFYKSSPWNDLLILFRSLPAWLYHDVPTKSDTLNLFGLKLRNITMIEGVQRMETNILSQKPSQVFFLNADCLNKSVQNQNYFNILNQESELYPDGIGIRLAGKILKTPLKENINGTDLFPFLIKMAEKNQFSLYFLGAEEHVLLQMIAQLKASHPLLKIAGFKNGFFDKNTLSQSVVEEINQSGANILLVGFGAPLQEQWIHDWRSQLQPLLCLGIGGLFDYFGGKNKRAPRWCREMGLEWLWRVGQEPQRMWKRYFVGNPLFLYRVLRWKWIQYGRQHE